MVTSGQPFPMSKLVFMYVKRLAEPLGTDWVPKYLFKSSKILYLFLVKIAPFMYLLWTVFSSSQISSPGWKEWKVSRYNLSAPRQYLPFLRSQNKIPGHEYRQSPDDESSQNEREGGRETWCQSLCWVLFLRCGFRYFFSVSLMSFKLCFELASYLWNWPKK